MAEGLLLVGAGGHACSCIEAIESTGLAIKGLVDCTDRVGQHVLGYPILGIDDDLPDLLRNCDGALVTVGQIRSPDVRIRLYRQLEQLGACMPVIMARSATVSRHASLGAGSIVLHGAIVNAAASVGVNVIVNSRALIEHDARIGDHCHIATGAIVNGGARVGEGSFIGSGAVIGEGVAIGARCIIGAGNTVLADHPDDTLIRGRA
jgi:sugar O-acyltransferase (sialic acid O-acetyltransferase NeuD family)